MPDGGARSATLERMSALSLKGAVRRWGLVLGRFRFSLEMDTYELAV
jgi:hypothetical protein